MSMTTHERPGVYSSYGASSLIRGSGGRKTVGLVAVNTTATANTVYTITSYETAVSTFGSTGGQDMAELIRVILLNGAGAVAAVPIASADGYEAGFAVLEAQENISVVVCDSTTQTDQQDLRDSVVSASSARRERIAVAAGAADETVTNLIARAKALNSERVVLVAPGGTSEEGTALSGLTAAAAVAGAIAAQGDPALPLSGAELLGLNGLSQQYNDNDIDLLVQGGVTPLEKVAGVVQDYYVFKMPVGGLLLKIPIASTQAVGLRAVIPRAEAERLIADSGQEKYQHGKYGPCFLFRGRFCSRVFPVYFFCIFQI